MSIIVDGQRIETPGLETVCWLDDPKVPRATDGRSRHAIGARAITLHTVHGKRGPLAPGVKASTRAQAYAVYQAHTSREVSWHFTVDTDGTIVQSADPALWVCWHAGSVNAWTVGIELVQETDGTLYEGQMAALVALCDLLCARLNIPRRVPVGLDGRPVAGVIARLTGTSGPWPGIFGHRNQTTNRGPGDPGDHPFAALLAAGYEGVPVDAHGHLA